jgi:hypothetical protein
MSSIAQVDGEIQENIDFLHTIPTTELLDAPRSAREEHRKGASNDVYVVRIEKTACLQDEWINWVSKQRIWKHFVSMTYREEITQEAALAMWYRFIRLLNRRVFGDHYTRIVHHSYFSYVLGIERQTRGVLHFHVLIDRPIDYAFIHKVWNDWAGFSWIEQIKPESNRDAIFYVSKYVVKGGELLPYFTDRQTTLMVPPARPLWWSEDVSSCAYGQSVARAEPEPVKGVACLQVPPKAVPLTGPVPVRSWPM